MVAAGTDSPKPNLLQQYEWTRVPRLKMFPAIKPHLPAQLVVDLRNRGHGNNFPVVARVLVQQPSGQVILMPPRLDKDDGPAGS